MTGDPWTTLRRGTPLPGSPTAPEASSLCRGHLNPARVAGQGRRLGAHRVKPEPARVVPAPSPDPVAARASWVKVLIDCTSATSATDCRSWSCMVDPTSTTVSAAGDGSTGRVVPSHARRPTRPRSVVVVRRQQRDGWPRRSRPRPGTRRVRPRIGRCARPLLGRLLAMECAIRRPGCQRAEFRRPVVAVGALDDGALEAAGPRQKHGQKDRYAESEVRRPRCRSRATSSTPWRSPPDTAGDAVATTIVSIPLASSIGCGSPLMTIRMRL